MEFEEADIDLPLLLIVHSVLLVFVLLSLAGLRYFYYCSVTPTGATHPLPATFSLSSVRSLPSANSTPPGKFGGALALERGGVSRSSRFTS